MDEAAAWRHLTSARVAALATIRPDGSPHLVPMVFAVSGRELLTAVDHKPKSSTRLQRLSNIAVEPRVAVLADGYAEDWTTLWWVRADGTGAVVEAGPVLDRAVSALVAKYPQYRNRPPVGPVIRIVVERISGWQGSPLAGPSGP